MKISTLGILIFTLSYLSTSAQVFYRIDRIEINSPIFNEMAPMIFEDGIIFSSDRKSDVVVVTVDQEGSYTYNLYHVKKKGYKNWGQVTPFARELSTRYNESSACVSSDGQTLYFTGTIVSPENVLEETNDSLNKNGIFISTWNIDKWSPPEPFPFNSEDYDIGNPFITDDDTRLYFSSRNPEGYGKFDLYYSDKKDGIWTDPVNLGPVINTSESEVFPFLYKENRLYFSSGGHDSQGGLDIFYSDWIDNEWTTPVNMPRPFNSRSDDFGFVANAEMDTGYFASNRRGTDDIYSFVSTFPAFSECPQQVDETFCYEFYESGTMILDTTSLRYEWDLGDGTKIRDIRVSHCYAEPGFYLVQLNVIDTLTGDIYFSQASYDLNIEPLEQPYILAPEKAYVNDYVDFDGSQSVIRSFKIQDYYWDFGDGSAETEVKTKHRYTKEGTYNVRLGITGTDEESKDKEQKACASRSITILRR